jgi:asparagine synthase (glutamine-hydrolysing)
LCGIAGVALAGAAPVDEAVLRAMTRTLAHRGPDGERFHLAPGIGLGHRRLVIVDPSDASSQPMRGARGVLTYNGEIYGYAAARAALEARGERFVSSGDVEVLLRTIERDGPHGLRALRGMFAFGYWSDHDRTLLLARDRQGEKPVYYAPFGSGGREGIAFASELRALLAHPRVRAERAIDDVAVGQLFLHEYVPAPRSILANVKKLPAGHMLAWSEARGAVVAPWDAPPESTWPPPRAKESGDPHALARELTRLVEQSVKEQMVADVPVGIFLSGGLDSSFVAACASRACGRVRTFSIGFDDPSFDESEHARAVARHIGSDHEEERLSERSLVDLVPEVLDFADEPLADGSLLPTTLLARLARRHVNVALGGDGGDELLAGYPTFVADRVLPTSPRVARAMGVLASHWPPSDANAPFAQKLRQASQGIGDRGARRHARFLAPIVPEDLAGLITREHAVASRDIWEPTDRASLGSEHAFDAATGFYLRCYLAEGVLTKIDRATMRASLEARAPLLDPRVVRFCLGLAPKHRLRALTTKWLMRRALAPLVPRAIVRRPKKGFGAPIGAWLRGPLARLMRDTLAPEPLRRVGLVNPSRVASMIDDHLARRRDQRKALWVLVVLMWWIDRWLA